MRFFASQLDAFAWGMAAGWLATYLSLTHEKRTVKSVRKAVVELASGHDLTPAQSRVLDRNESTSDEEVWGLYRWAQGVLAGDPRRPGFARREIWRLARRWVIGLPGLPFAQHPAYVAAEVVLCTKVLGLTEAHARRVLRRSKTMADINQTLAAVTAEIDEERRQWQEKEAAEEAIKVERQAKVEAAWEAERNGDPDWFAKLLAADEIALGRLKPRK